MENEEQSNTLNSLGGKYLTEEQIAYLKEEFEKDGMEKHVDELLKTLKGYLIENNTMTPRLRTLYSLIAVLGKINKDDILMENQFISPAFIYYPFSILGLLVEVGIYDPKNIRVETSTNPAHPFFFANKPKNEA